VTHDRRTALFSGHAESLARSIVLCKLGGAQDTAQDVEDVCSEVVVRLLAVLEQGAAISDLPAYVARTSYNACNEYFRRRFPQRHRLKVRLRKVLRETPGFAVWHDQGRGWLCGLKSWRGRAPARPMALSIPPAAQDLEDLPAAIFRQSGAPVELDALVDQVAEAWGIYKHPVTIDSVAAQLSAEPERPAEDPRPALDQVWREVRELPVPQRQALLMNLRAPDGGSALALLPHTGAASMTEIAEALEMPVAELARLWESLPVDDASLARRMGLTRQQVINLRKSARHRLARRMRMHGAAGTGPWIH